MCQICLVQCIFIKHSHNFTPCVHPSIDKSEEMTRGNPQLWTDFVEVSLRKYTGRSFYLRASMCRTLCTLLVFSNFQCKQIDFSNDFHYMTDLGWFSFSWWIYEIVFTCVLLLSKLIALSLKYCTIIIFFLLKICVGFCA